MTTKPDWIVCVRNEQTRRTWCNEEIVFQFCFQDFTHADNNALTGGRLVVCDECKKRFFSALECNT